MSFADLLQTELTYARNIINLPKSYEKDSFDRYHLAVAPLVLMNQAGTPIGEELGPMLEAVRAARESLVPIPGNEKTYVPLWGDDMPQAEDAEAYDYTYAVDNKGFRPFLVPYLLGKPEAAKGTVIIVAGGAFAVRANIVEGYPVAEAFNKLGYNAFVLQRRVFPFTPLDSFLDLQRSIRLVRHSAAALGLFPSGKIIVCGFSGGGGTILGALDACYGDIQPDRFYRQYTPDIVDAENSDPDAAIILYGYGNTPDGQSALGKDFADGFLKDNPRLPPMFIGCGSKDEVIVPEGSAELYTAVCKRTPAELHIFAGAGHGFGTGRTIDTTEMPLRWKTVTNVSVWPELADTFLQLQFGTKELDLFD